MSRGRQTFRQRDVTKALKAAVKAGIPVERVEIEKNGKIVVVTTKMQTVADEEKPGNNEWDQVLH